MIKSKIDQISGEEGWSQSTQITVLIGVLDKLISQGIVDQEEVIDLTEEWRSDSDPMPSIGDDVEMEGVECEIEVAEVPDDQPKSDEGIYTIIDQHGESHQIESNGEIWIVLVE